MLDSLAPFPTSHQDLLRAWILKNTSLRTRKEEERCIVARQAKRASGLRLFLRPNDHDDGNNVKSQTVMPTLMGIRPGGGGNETGTVKEVDEGTSTAAEEVCMLHFQGPKSKELIVPFEAFLEGSAGAKEGHDEFVLP